MASQLEREELIHTQACTRLAASLHSAVSASHDYWRVRQAPAPRL